MDKIVYKEKEYEVKYLREAQHGRRGEITVAYIDLQDGHQLIGLAERSPRDPYDEEQARTVSLGRLSKKAKKRSKITPPCSHGVEAITEPSRGSNVGSIPAGSTYAPVV